MNHTVVASFSFALLVGVALLVREVRFRRSLQKLLYRLLAFWRTNSNEERKSIAVERRFESLLAPVINTTGVLLVAALPLVLCWYLLHGLRGHDEEVSEVLISQLVRQSPELLGTRRDRPGIGQRTASSDDEEAPF